MNWHDFAFFDPVMYESLRQLILASQSTDADAVFAAMDLAFAIDLCKEEGGGQVRTKSCLTVSSELYNLCMLSCMYNVGSCKVSNFIFYLFLDSNTAFSLDIEVWGVWFGWFCLFP